MKINTVHSLSLIIILLSAVISPASGAINTISQGNTVFIGEQGLDISAVMDGDTQVGWWASAASISDSAPSSIVSVSSPTSFSITSSLFGSHTGEWYRLTPQGKANGSAFNVMDPQLAIRIEDTSVSVDVTDKWVPTDDELRFRIDTNLVPIAQRTGVTSVPITIKVQNPGGGTYSGLLNSAGISTSIVDIPVTTTPYYTASIWNTSFRDTYPPGTYTIWAECNVNAMKDNYEQSGKTVSQKVTLKNQDQNPIISGKTPIATIPPVVVTSAVVSTTPVTPAATSPISTTPVSTTAVPDMTPAVPVSEVPADIPTTASPSPQPTFAPGFGPALLITAFCFSALLYRRIR